MRLLVRKTNGTGGHPGRANKLYIYIYVYNTHETSSDHWIFSPETQRFRFLPDLFFHRKIRPQTWYFHCQSNHNNFKSKSKLQSLYDYLCKNIFFAFIKVIIEPPFSIIWYSYIFALCIWLNFIKKLQSVTGLLVFIYKLVLYSHKTYIDYLWVNFSFTVFVLTITKYLYYITY